MQSALGHALQLAIPQLLQVPIGIEFLPHFSHELVIPLQVGGGCPEDASQICSMLQRIRGFLVTILFLVGVIAFLAGAGLYFAGTNENMVRWGKRLMAGGVGMILVALLITPIINLLQFFATG